MRLSYLDNGNLYIGKTLFSYWDPQPHPQPHPIHKKKKKKIHKW